VVVTSPYNVGILGFPDLLAEPISADEVITETFFIPLAKRSAPIPGIVLDQVLFGAFRLAWDVSAASVSLLAVSNFIHRNTTSFYTWCRWVL
jgi:hypothetical protein